MKKTISIFLILITFNVFSQDLEIGEKKELNGVENFDKEYNNFTIEGKMYKGLQFKDHNPTKYVDKNLGYKKKSVRIKPLGIEFFDRNYILHYWQTDSGKVRIFMEACIIKTRFKEDKDSTKLNQLAQN